MRRDRETGLVSRRGFAASALLGVGAALLGGCSLNGVMPGSSPIELPVVNEARLAANQGAPAAARVLEGGTLTCQSVPLSTVNPHEAWGYWERLVCRCMFDSLTQYDFDQMTLVGKAATSWEADLFSERFTFHLREGMAFQNGESVTSTCFANAWNVLVAHGGHGLASCLSMVAGFEDVAAGVAGAQLDLECPDDYTLIVNLAHSFPDFAYLASLPQLAPMSVASFKAEGGFGDVPCGNGPFCLDGALQADAGVHLVRNASYWGTNAHVDALQFQVNEDFTDVGEAIKTGNLDVTLVPVDQASALSDELGPAGPDRILNSDAQVAHEGFRSVCMLVCNCAREPFDQAKTRRALERALDVQVLATALGLDPLCAADGALLPSNLGYEERAWKLPDHELEKGLSDQVDAALGTDELEMLCDPCLLAGLGQEVAAQLDDAGVTVCVDTPSWSEYLSRLQEGDFELALVCHLPPCDAAGAELFSLFHSRGGDNLGGYASAEVDEALESAWELSDEAARLDVLREVCQTIAQDMPVVPLLYAGPGVACSSRVNSLAVSADYTLDFAGCWLSA